MSIASEFDSTIENIKSDYEGLENIGADLTNIDKNIYNIRTCLDNIYTNLPKTTGEGSNLSLTTLKGRINVDDILGDTQQDSTTGKNVLPNTLTNGTSNGITWTVNSNGTIKVNGTATSNVAIYVARSLTFASGSYILSGCPSGGSNTTYSMVLEGTARDTGSGKTFTNASNKSVIIEIISGTSCNNLLFKPMIETGSTITTYEQYTGGQASPNPTYPQDINVVTGTQEVVVQNKNLFNKDNYNYINAWFLVGSSNISSKSGNDTIIYIKCMPSTTYTISKILEPNTSKNTLVAGTTTDIPNYGVALNVKAGQQGTTITDVTITTGSNDKYLCVFCHSLNVNNTYNVTEMLATLQIEIGSTKTDFVEHQEQTKTLHLGDIELAKIGTYQDRIFESSGKNKFDKDNVESGKYYNINGVILTSSNWNIAQIEVQPNTNYYLSGNNYNNETAGIVLLDESKNFISLVSSYKNVHLITTTATTKYIGLSIANYSGSSDMNSIMLNLGSSALPYEPYGSDKWYIEKNIGKYTINGASGSFSKPSTNRFNIDGALTDYLKAINVVTCMSDKYVCYAQKGSNGDFNSLVANESFGLDLSFSTSGNTIRIKDTNYDDINQYKTWLASNNVELLYILATPTYTEITNETLLNELNELEKMMSYNGQTNISVSGNLPMILDVSALKGE